MFRTKLALSFLGLATVLTASSAFANHPDFDRGFGRGGGRYRCQLAQQNLNNAQNGLNQAVLILSQAQNICGGAIACIFTAQNHYNQQVQNVQAAQREVHFACRPNHRPPHGGGGWGRPIPPHPGRPVPPIGRPPFPGGRPGHGGGGFPGHPVNPDMPMPDDTQEFPPVVFGE